MGATLIYACSHGCCHRHPRTPIDVQQHKHTHPALLLHVHVCSMHNSPAWSKTAITVLKK